MAGNAAELKLQISLDLAYFRAQLSRLPIEAAGYSAPINVKINQQSIADQYRLLNKYFGKKEFRIEINSNLEAEIKNAGRLVKALQSVQKVGVKTTGGLPLGVGQLGIKKPTGGLGVEEIKKLFNASIEAGLLDPKTLGKTREQMVTALGSIGRDSIEGLLNGLDSGNGKVRSAAESLGKDLIATTKNVLGIASPSKIFDALGRFTAEGFDDGFTKRFKKFKGDAIAEIGQFIARVKTELAKVGGFISGDNTPAERLFRQSTAYSAPIGPLPLGSGAPWARGSRGMYGSSGFEPRMESRARGQAYPAPPGSFLAFSRAASQIGRGGAPSSFFEFSQRASLVKQGGGGGFVPPGGFPTEGMLGGKAGPSTFIGAGSSMEKFKTAIDIASVSMRNFRASSLPLIGGLREIGGEFLNATKQVLLYGTAYKGLAFITSLPGQILNAAKSQQQFNNAMQTATQDTGTFAKEMLYVDNIQRAFGLSLETTRQGFVRLYASMAPTGFDSGSIEKLFTGISAATAALQLTPDKAERVIYAFGQMASKGQIMSEELKGQLGDVLPGALAIFAKAAGMSVKEFSQAMEDGVFVGGKFREVFAKVSDELMNRFGTGAQAAGKSLQGLLNTVQGDFQRTLESFAPLANVAAQAILMPLSGALKQLSMAAQIAMGEQERAQKQLISAQRDVKDLQIGGAKPEQILAAQQNVAALQAKIESLNLAAKDPAIVQQAKNLQSFASEIGKAGTAVMNIAKAIGSVLNPVMTFLGTNLSSVITALASFAIGLAAVRIAATVTMTVLTLLNVLVRQVSGNAVGINALSVAFRGLGISATTAQIGVIGLGTAFRVLLFSSGLGIAVGLFTAIATAALGMGDAMKQAAEQTKQTMKDMAQAAIQGNTALITMQAGVAQANLATLSTVKGEVLRGGGKTTATGRASAQTLFKLTPVQKQMLAAAGAAVPEGLLTKEQLDKVINDAQYVNKVIVKAGQNYASIAERNAARMGLNKPAPPAPGVGNMEETGAGKGGKLASYYSDATKQLQNQLAIDINTLDLQRESLQISETQYELRKAQLQFDTESQIIEEQKTLALKQANKENLSAIDLARKKKDIERDAASANAKARSDLNKAQASARMKLEAPITRAIIDETAAIDKQQVLMSNYTRGITQLSAAQEAELAIRELTKYKGQDEIALMKEQYDALQDLIKARIENNRLVEQEANLAGLRAQIGVAGAGLGAGFIGEAGGAFEKALLESQGNVDYAMQMARLTEQLSLLKLNADLTRQSIEGIGGAFATTLVDGSMALAEGSKTAQEVFADFLRSIAKILADAAKQMIATYIAIGIARMFAGIRGGGGGGGLEAYTPQGNAAFMERTGALGFANGGIVMGGFKAFADGGVVTGPTLGLVGEGRYNEAIIPMPNGRSVPVDLQGAAGGNTNVVVNVDAKGSAASGDDTRANALGRVIASAVQEELIRQKRPGGLLTQ